MRKLTLALGLAVALAGSFAGSASAAYYWTAPQLVSIPSDGGAMTFSKWNPALYPADAVLVAAEWDASVTLVATSTLKNKTASTKTIANNAQWQATGNVDIVDETTTLATASLSQTFIGTGSPPITTTFTAGQTKTGSFSKSDHAITVLQTPVDDLARFTGSGTFDVNANLWGSITTPLPTSTWEASAGDVYIDDGGQLSLRYQYESQGVPEPATIALVGLGCLGLIRRRKAKKQA